MWLAALSDPLRPLLTRYVIFLRSQFQAALAGCVPVVIGDGVLEAWEPYLDWNDFGVRVAEADIPRLHTILGAIGPEVGHNGLVG